MNPRRLLVIEILGTAFVITISELSEGHAPQPRAYIASFVVFLLLSGVAYVNAGAAKFAVAFGGLVLLAVLIAHAGGIVSLANVITTGGKEGS